MLKNMINLLKLIIIIKILKLRFFYTKSDLLKPYYYITNQSINFFDLDLKNYKGINIKFSYIQSINIKLYIMYSNIEEKKYFYITYKLKNLNKNKSYSGFIIQEGYYLFQYEFFNNNNITIDFNYYKQITKIRFFFKSYYKNENIYENEFNYIYFLENLNSYKINKELFPINEIIIFKPNETNQETYDYYYSNIFNIYFLENSFSLNNFVKKEKNEYIFYFNKYKDIEDISFYNLYNSFFIYNFYFKNFNHWKNLDLKLYFNCEYQIKLICEDDNILKIYEKDTRKILINKKLQKYISYSFYFNFKKIYEDKDEYKTIIISFGNNYYKNKNRLNIIKIRNITNQNKLSNNYYDNFLYNVEYNENITFNTISYYTFDHINFKKFNEYKVIINQINGKINKYIDLCQFFPNCNYNISILQNIKNIEKDNFILKLNEIYIEEYTNQSIFIIQCKSKINCIFSIKFIPFEYYKCYNEIDNNKCLSLNNNINKYFCCQLNFYNYGYILNNNEKLNNKCIFIENYLKDQFNSFYNNFIYDFYDDYYNITKFKIDCGNNISKNFDFDKNYYIFSNNLKYEFDINFHQYKGIKIYYSSFYSNLLIKIRSIKNKYSNILHDYTYVSYKLINNKNNETIDGYFNSFNGYIFIPFKPENITIDFYTSYKYNFTIKFHFDIYNKYLLSYIFSINQYYYLKGNSEKYNKYIFYFDKEYYYISSYRIFLIKYNNFSKLKSDIINNEKDEKEIWKYSKFFNYKFTILNIKNNDLKIIITGYEKMNLFIKMYFLNYEYLQSKLNIYYPVMGYIGYFQKEEKIYYNVVFNKNDIYQIKILSEEDIILIIKEINSNILYKMEIKGKESFIYNKYVKENNHSINVILKKKKMNSLYRLIIRNITNQNISLYNYYDNYLNNVIYNEYLTSGTISYYSLDKISFQNYDYIYLYIKKMSGNIKIYIHQCESFPICNYNSKIIEEIKKNKNKFIEIKENKNKIKVSQLSLDNCINKSIIIIHCLDNVNCNFSIFLSNINYNENKNKKTIIFIFFISFIFIIIILIIIYKNYKKLKKKYLRETLKTISKSYIKLENLNEERKKMNI